MVRRVPGKQLDNRVRPKSASCGLRGRAALYRADSVERNARRAGAPLAAVALAIGARIEVGASDVVVGLVAEQVSELFGKLSNLFDRDRPEPVGERPHPAGVIRDLEAEPPIVGRVSCSSFSHLK